MYSKSCEYVIRVIGYMMTQKKDKRFLAAKICKALRIPEFYTRKGLQILSRIGVLKSIPGPGGGYQLARDAGRLSVFEIICAVDGENSFNHCVMGMPHCNQKNPCAIHNVWAGTKQKLLDDLNAVKLDDLGDGRKRKKILKRIGNSKALNK